MRVITVARKPLTKSVAKTTLDWGCGGINIDASRTGSSGGTQKPASDDKCTTEHTVGGYLNAKAGEPVDGMGRWPANVFVQHSVGCRLEGGVWVCEEGWPVTQLDGQRGITTSRGGGGPKSPVWTPSTPDQQRKDYGEFTGYLDTGGVARYFKQVPPCE